MALSMAETQLACSRAVGEHIGGVPFKSVANGNQDQTTARIALGFLSENQYEVVMNTRQGLANQRQILENQQVLLANQAKIMAHLGIEA